MSQIPQVLIWLLLAAAAGLFTWAVTAAIRPWLISHATVQPNRRSTHVVPTPQGAGIAVVPVMLVVAAGALVASGSLPNGLWLHAIVVAVATLVLMCVGFIDDIRNLSIIPRLALQALAVGAIVVTLPPDLRVVPGHFSWPVERGLLFFGGLWFVNLFNFMDGIDLLSVTETVAITGGIAIFAWFGFVPVWLGWVAVSLLGAVLGFAPWNAPPARLFLGDAGSISIGLIVGTLLIHVAGAYFFVAALILPLYFLMDATITFLRRLLRVERFWEAHRDHFYQAAVRNGLSTSETVKIVATLNVALIALALVTVLFTNIAVTLISLFVAMMLVLYVFRRFSIGQR